jgi:hypothetical protein
MGFNKAVRKRYTMRGIARVDGRDWAYVRDDGGKVDTYSLSEFRKHFCISARKVKKGAKLTVTELVPEPDLRVSGGGSVYLLVPVSDAGREWMTEHLPQDAIGLGDGVAVEHRYMSDILEGIADAGLVVE